MKTVHTPKSHDSAPLHVTGKAQYIDDILSPHGLLHGALGLSEAVHAKIISLDLEEVRSAKGVIAVLTGQDLLHNDISPTGKNDEPILASDFIHFHKQPLFFVVAETREAARLACLKANVTYEHLKPITTINQALEMQRIVTEPMCLTLGESTKALRMATNKIESEIIIGGQDHFYLETHIALATPTEEGVHLFSSTQHPSEVQHMVALCLHLPLSKVTVEVRRMGGGFGGKETQSNLFAVLAAITAHKLNRPVKLRPDRDEDMQITGKRHDFQIPYEIAYDYRGKIEAVEATFAARCGYSADLSGPITDRALFHADNCYFLKNATLKSLPLYTNTLSNTAFRGFGGPQGMVFAERLIEEIAIATGQDALDVRYTNLYSPAQNTTPYHQKIDDFVFIDLMQRLEKTSNYRARREVIKAFNQNSRYVKRGLALTPVKFGISFTASWYNQAGALLHIYQDGSVLVNHGGTEMGQGLHIKICQIVAETLEIPLDQVQISATRTDKVPNTSATAASSGADLNGQAARVAALTLKARLEPFTGNFKQRVKQAYMARVSLSSTGFYKTPDIHWNRATGQGHPFYYYACGAACSEVEIDCLTGENRTLKTDILHDCGSSLNEAIDRGQIEGGFIQGLGWLTTEELVYDHKGHLKTHAPSTYKIPLASDIPEMTLNLWDQPHSKSTIYRSKAVGEPPLMLAISVLVALGDAVASTAQYKMPPRLDPPATPEKILNALQRLKNV